MSDIHLQLIHKRILSIYPPYSSLFAYILHHFCVIVKCYSQIYSYKLLKIRICIEHQEFE